MDKDLSVLLKRMADDIGTIAKNTSPPGLFRRIVDWAALFVGVSGILAVIEQIIEWVRG